MIGPTKIIVPRRNGDITIEVSKVFKGQGTDLIALARHWYYALLFIMWVGFAGDVVKVIAWAVRTA